MPTVARAEDRDPFAFANDLLAGCSTLLDVGAGTGDTLARLNVQVKLGLDIHRPYLEHWPPMSGIAIPLHLPARALRRVFLPRSIDAVSFLDSLEHLPPQEARKVLRAAEHIARKLVLIFTPRGFFPQQAFDARGLGGDRHQQHLSGWEPGDFTVLGYDVLVFSGFHGEENEAFLRAFGPGTAPVDALMAYKRVKSEM